MYRGFCPAENNP